MHCDQRADNGRDHRIYQAIIDRSPNVASLQLSEAIFRKLHSSGLRTANQHVHLDFQAAELIEHLALEVVVGHAHHQSLWRRFVNTIVNSGHRELCKHKD